VPAVCRYGTTYKHHYVCLACRSSVKHEWVPEREHRCPRCRAVLVDAGYDLAVPPRRDESAWTALTATLRAGITFHSCGCGGPGFRPRTSAQVRERRAAARRLAVPQDVALERAEPWEP
jgi:hypothetical protein